MIWFIVSVIYILVGIYVTYDWWNKLWKDEYEKIDDNNVIDDGVLTTTILFIIFLWPICLFLINKNNKNNKNNKK